MNRTFNLTTLFLALGALPLPAQPTTLPPAPAYQAFSPDQLDQLLGPIALYPDPLLSEILPAATFPTEIALAERFVTGGIDPNIVPQPSWDASVQALTHYPAVLKWMNDNPLWTAELGEVFVNQQLDVINSIQRLRMHAAKVGNLKSTPQEDVVNDSDEIEIVPAHDDSLYVPDYEDNAVYYQAGYPLVFGGPFPIGGWLCRDFDWYHHQLVCWDINHPRPQHWWRQSIAQRSAGLASDVTVWHPEKPTQTAAAGGYHGGGTRTPIVNRALPGINSPPASPVRVKRPAPAAEWSEFVEGRRSTGAQYGGRGSLETHDRLVTESGRPIEPERPAEPEHFTKFSHLIEPANLSQPTRRAEPENRREPEYRPEPASRGAPSFSGGSAERGSNNEKNR